MNELATSILESGAYVIVSDLEGQASLTARVRALILDAVGEIAGASARRSLEQRGLGTLHEQLPAEQIGALRDRVMGEVRPELFRFACTLGESLLGLEREFFVDDYTILRVNYPYEVALNASDAAENPGIGRVDPDVRGKASSTQKRDAVYDPKGYHRNTPPASWAHGPHKDTWTGHSRGGLNLWWAIDDVVEENSMILYPSTFDRLFEADPRSLYVAEGYRLPKPRKMAMRAGELLVFNPELLHATHLNTSGRTRLALSARINLMQPRFAPGCFYAREFWHSSVDISHGRTDVIRQFKRDENLEDPSGSTGRVVEAKAELRTARASRVDDGWHVVPVDALDLEAERQLVELADGRKVALLREDERWVAVQATCPHLDLSLMDGFSDSEAIFCPAHGVAFRLDSGRSSSRLLRLETYDVAVDVTSLRIRLRQP